MKIFKNTKSPLYHPFSKEGKREWKKEKFVVLLLFAVLICAVYFQVAWGGKSLLSTLYYPHPFCN
ncbi:MAG: hypothetical protein V1662_03565, partial [Candidatus Omnitrophota bacterium]